MKVTFKILLVAAVILLGYMCYRSIMGPIEFKRERASREEAIIARLIDIRKAQIEYKNIYKEHTPSFDTLAKFLNEKKLPFVYKEGVLTDVQLDKGLTEQKALALIAKAQKSGKWDEVKKEGLENFKRDTIWVLAKDTLFGPQFNADSLRFIPGFAAQFKMDTASISNAATGFTIKVFEASIDYDTYLGDLNKREVANLKDLAQKLNRFSGLRVGSLTELNNYAGNWE